MIVGVIQARMGSKRLRGKSILPLAGKPLLSRFIERVKRSALLDKVVLATTDKQEDDCLCSLSGKLGIEVTRWHEENDLIARILRCAQRDKADTIVRLCADNPLIEAEEIDRIITHYLIATKRGVLFTNTHNVKDNGYPDGLLLMERMDDLKDNFTTVTVSVFEDDPKQFESIKGFVEYIGSGFPKTYIKMLGDCDNPEFEKMKLKVMRRSIHAPKGDVNYQGSKPPIPELGICLDFLFKPSIDYEGNFFICNRYDPECKGMLGNIKTDTLEWMWNSPLRQHWLHLHKIGRRDLMPLCSGCEFWGIPTNG